MMGVSGNESLLNREPVLYNRAIRYVPVLSGNAIRHKMVRHPGAYHLIKTCGLIGKLTLDQANYLFNGGSLTESSTTDNLAKIAEMQELLPLIRLLGGSLRNQVVGGSLIVKRGMLVCEENRALIERELPEELLRELPEQRLRSCEDFISRFQYTRMDALKLGVIDPSEEDEREKSNQMIYAGQKIIAGAVFYHGFILQNVSRLEVGAILNALYEWNKHDSTIGGMSRVGHGILETSLTMEKGEDFFGHELNLAGLIIEYQKHCEENRDKIVEWLNNAFPRKEKVIKEKKGAKPKKTPVELTDSFEAGLVQDEVGRVF
jgi:hypothetical protein